MSVPLVVAALRRVDTRASVDPLSGAVHTDQLGGRLSAADESALEHALTVAAALDGRCLAVTVGEPGADDVLRHALSVGADEALRVTSTVHTEEQTARALADAVSRRHGTPSVVLCGDHSVDRGTGATPAFLAAALGARQALGLLWLEVLEGRLRAQRRLDGGRRERLAIELPAVCSVEPTNRLRRASLPGVLAARHATIDTVESDVASHDAGTRVKSHTAFRPRTRAVPDPDGDTPNQRVLALAGVLSEREPPRLVHPADAGEAADELIGYLSSHGYLP